AGREDYYVYVGRLSPEKGVETLLNVASKLPCNLKVAGDGPLMVPLKQQYSENSNIEFCGRLDSKQVAELLSKAQFSVMPSECYDNNPLGVIESLCAGTPVVGARIGGIPELLDEGNGITFASGNRDDLASAINQAFSTQWHYSSIKEAAGVRFSLNKHLEQVMEIYGA
ncbi:MAG: glycosyltransferase, partial [Muribaculaceae bacterium]|nr:glycosyltransferase [Muribaculaceae bacterium]